MTVALKEGSSLSITGLNVLKCKVLGRTLKEELDDNQFIKDWKLVGKGRYQENSLEMTYF